MSTYTASPRVLRTSLTYRKPTSLVAVGLRIHYAQVTGSMRGTPNKVCKETWFDQSNGACRLAGICTGYGPKGFHLSAFLADQFPKSLFRKSVRKDFESIKITLAQTYAECERSMRDMKGKSRDSGVYISAVLITENALISLNVGDGKAVIGRNIAGIWGLYQLIWGEKVDFRVFPKPYSEYQIPKHTTTSQTVLPRLGLASTRKSIRLSPELSSLKLTVNDRFLLLASSGLWDVIDSIEAVRLVQSLWSESLENITKSLSTEAERRWQLRGPKVSDVTVLLVKFLS